MIYQVSAPSSSESMVILNKIPSNRVSAETKNLILQFLEILQIQYGEGIAPQVYKCQTQQETTVTQMETANLVLLLSHYSYHKLCQSYYEANPHSMTSRSTFYCIWKSSEYKTLKIRKP